MSDHELRRAIKACNRTIAAARAGRLLWGPDLRTIMRAIGVPAGEFGNDDRTGWRFDQDPEILCRHLDDLRDDLRTDLKARRVRPATKENR